MAGVAISLYGLRSARNWGVGDFTDLRARRSMRSRPPGAAFIALNPLHAIPNRQPYNTSPYLPLCSLYRNFLYLDVERVPGICSRRTLRDGEIEALRKQPNSWNMNASRTSSCAALRRAFARFREVGPHRSSTEFVRDRRRAAARFRGVLRAR